MGTIIDNGVSVTWSEGVSGAHRDRMHGFARRHQSAAGRGRVLRERGDEVRIGCTVESQEHVASHGFEPHILTTLNLKEFLQSPVGQEKFFGACPCG